MLVSPEQNSASISSEMSCLDAIRRVRRWTDPLHTGVHPRLCTASHVRDRGPGRSVARAVEPGASFALQHLWRGRNVAEAVTLVAVREALARRARLAFVDAIVARVMRMHHEDEHGCDHEGEKTTD